MFEITAPIWVGVLIGFVIGALAEAWGIANPETLIRLARWKDRLFVGCILLGAGVASVVLYALYASGVYMHFSAKPLYLPGVTLGAVLFGIGLAVSGYFPGSIWMALGEGRRDALYAMIGGLLGAATWTYMFQTPVGQWLVNTENLGPIIITGQSIHSIIDPETVLGVAIIYGLMFLAVSYYLPRYPGTNHSCLRSLITRQRCDLNPRMEEARKDTAKYLMEGSIDVGELKAEKLASNVSSQPNYFAPYMVLVAVGVGLAVVLGIVLHQIFGESTTYSWIVGWSMMPDYKYSIGVIRNIGWEPYSDLGTFLGAFFSSILVTRRFTAFRNIIPPSWRNRFGSSTGMRFLGSFSGGYLMLFGARMAGGCASGHILSGAIQMAVSGLWFGVFVMVSALVTAKLVYGNSSERVEQ